MEKVTSATELRLFLASMPSVTDRELVLGGLEKVFGYLEI